MTTATIKRRPLAIIAVALIAGFFTASCGDDEADRQFAVSIATIALADRGDQSAPKSELQSAADDIAAVLRDHPCDESEGETNREIGERALARLRRISNGSEAAADLEMTLKSVAPC